jgi:hypothetical protein
VIRAHAAALAAALVVSAPPARAAFDDAGWGPRDAAMGAAFTAVTDDPAVMSYNPGALGMASAPEAGAAYLRQFHPPAGESDRDSSRLSGVLPARLETLNGAAGVDIRYDRREAYGQDRSFGFYYGTRGWREREDGGIDFGGGLKFMSSTMKGGGKAGLKPAIDMGGLWRFKDRYAAGASLLNFFSPKFSGGGVKDRAPLALKVGLAEQVRGTLLALDFTLREPSAGQDGTKSLGAGFERWWATARYGQYALRSGMNLGDKSKTWRWGMGWRGLGGRVDYAMIVPIEGTTRVGHGVSVSMRFGGSDPEGEYERLLSRELRYRKEMSNALESSSTKQWKLAEELNRMRGEMSRLREEIERRSSSEEEARRRLQELDRKRRAAEEAAAILRGQSNREASLRFADDWRAYQRAKLGGAPDAALVEQVQRLLREYRNAGVDLGEANQELRRLQSGR